VDFSVAFEGIARAWGARSLNSAYLVLTAWRLVGAALAVWLLGVMLPFYGTINSFMGAIGVPALRALWTVGRLVASSAPARMTA